MARGRSGGYGGEVVVMRRTATALTVALTLGLTAGSALAGPKPPGPPPQQSQEVTYTDPTPDPTGLAVGTDGHCSGLLPKEAPHRFTAPGRGTLKVALGGFEGVWGLHIQDAKGNVIADTDSTNGAISLTAKAKTRGTVIDIAPCNLAGSPEATITLVFTFA